VLQVLPLWAKCWQVLHRLPTGLEHHLVSTCVSCLAMLMSEHTLVHGAFGIDRSWRQLHFLFHAVDNCDTRE
jgi:hypothetical protein